MTTVEVCPSCGMSLRLFTPRECERHVNDCLDSETPVNAVRVECAVCKKDISALTDNAQSEHANRCADSLLPKKSRRRPASSSTAGSSSGIGILPQHNTPGLDPKLKTLLDALGLARYASKFASEEIDLDALRLLTDSDLSQLRIPDSARRRIAEALHSVTLVNIIAQHSNPDNTPFSHTSPQTPAPLTQQFQESRVADGVRRRDTNLLNLDSDSESDDELLDIYDSSSNAERNVEEMNNIGNDDKESGETRGTELGLNVGDDHSLGGDGKAPREDDSPVYPSNPGKSVQLSTPLETGGDASTAVEEYPQTTSPSLSTDCDAISLTPEHHRVYIPTTIAELEEWHTECTQDEIQRHKRKLKAIEQRYRRLKRRMEEKLSAGVSKPNFVISNSPIDLTLDDTPVITQPDNDATVQCIATRKQLSDVTPVKEQGASCRLPEYNEKATIAAKQRSPRKKGRLANFQSQILDDDSSSSSSSSDDDFTTTTTTTLASLIANARNRRLASGNRSCDGGGDDDTFEKAQAVDEEENGDGLSCLQDEVVAQSCDELMDLTQIEHVHRALDNRYEANMDDFNTRESCSHVPSSNNRMNARVSAAGASSAPTCIEPLSSGPVSSAGLSIPTDTITEPVSSCSPLATARNVQNASASTQGHDGDSRLRMSRLRKAKKVTSSDLRCAIRADPKLLDDMLLLNSVDIDRVMASVKSFGLKVSKKALVCFMHAEGLPFKEVATVNNNEKSKQFFASLCTEGFYK